MRTVGLRTQSKIAGHSALLRRPILTQFTSVTAAFKPHCLPGSQLAPLKDSSYSSLSARPVLLQHPERENFTKSWILASQSQKFHKLSSRNQQKGIPSQLQRGKPKRYFATRITKSPTVYCFPGKFLSRSPEIAGLSMNGRLRRGNNQRDTADVARGPLGLP